MLRLGSWQLTNKQVVICLLMWEEFGKMKKNHVCSLSSSSDLSSSHVLTIAYRDTGKGFQSLLWPFMKIVVRFQKCLTEAKKPELSHSTCTWQFNLLKIRQHSSRKATNEHECSILYYIWPSLVTIGRDPSTTLTSTTFWYYQIFDWSSQIVVGSNLVTCSPTVYANC